jgi:hypothetical protein
VKGETVSLTQPASTTLQAVAIAQCLKSLPQRRMPCERTFHTTTDRSSFAVAALLSRQGYCTVKNGGWNAIMVPGIHADTARMQLTDLDPLSASGHASYPPEGVSKDAS